MASSLNKDVLDILKENEELIVAIEKIDHLEKVAKSLNAHEVISCEDYQNFLSLDPNTDHLDPGLKARYLLHLTLLSFKSKKSKILLFLKILSSYEVMKSVTYNLLKQITKHERDEPNTSTLCDDDTIIVLEMHVGVLAEVLNDIRHKWEEIGVALHLTEADLEECRNNRTNSLKLYHVLLQWYKCNVIADLKTLKEALGSSIVAETTRSEKFIAEFKKKTFTVNLPHTTQTRSHTNYFHNVGSNNLQVSDGKSTIVEVKGTNDEVEEYYWCKDGQQLCDGLKYAGVHQKMLLIKHACQGISGVYTCNAGNTEAVRMTLKVNFSLEKSSLLKIYSKIPEISKDSWPPVGSSTFIKLALINEERPIQGIHNDSVRGDMDDILKEKKIEQYESLFEIYEEGAPVLVEGRPGSGKTTLTRKLSKDWATKPDILIGANLVFLISLRALKITSKENLTLSFILEPYYSSTDQRKRLIDIIEKENGKNFCFIVDGLDEYKDRNTKDNLIYKLVNKNYLHSAMVIVASRPIGSVNLRHREITSKRIEVLGFSKESIYDYIDSYFLHNEKNIQKGNELKQYLTAHINLLHMCYLPVHAAMICFIYQQPIEDIPVTETNMYECFTLLTIKRKLESDGLSMEYDTLSSLDGNILESFQKVCKLAFDMTIQSKQTITLSPTLSQNDSDVHSLGLVTIDKTAKLLGLKDLYSFLHLTFQEFLAAFHVKKCPVEEQMGIVIKYVDNKEMLNVWKFYCGLNTFDLKTIGCNKIMASKCLNDMYKIQCAFESQQNEVCEAILHHKESRNLQFDDHAFLPIDLNALAYTWNRITTPVNELAFNGCILCEADAQISLDRIKKEKLDDVKLLSFSVNNQDIEQYKAIRLLINKCQCLNELRLESDIGRQEVDILTKNITLSSLRYLKLHVPLRKEKFKRSYSDKHLLTKISKKISSLEEVRYKYNERSNVKYQKCLIALMQSFKCKIRPACEIPIGVLSNVEISGLERLPEFFKLSNLVLVNCNLFDSHLESLKSLVSKNLEIIKLDCNKIACNEATILPLFLEKCTKLTHMSLSCNMIDKDGAMTIAHSLKPFLKLLELDLQGNKFGDEGALALANAADKMCDDFRLILGNCHISNEKCERIVEITKNVEFRRQKLFQLPQYLGLSHPGSVKRALPCFKNLITLNISGIGISRSAFTEFANYLKYYNFLQTLDLSFCKIKNLRVLFNNSNVIPNLRSLNLSGNKLSVYSFPSSEDLNIFANLKELDLSQNNLQDIGVESDAYSFKHIKLEALNLSDNFIGPEGAAALARWLRIGNGLFKFEEDDITSKDNHNAVSVNNFILTSLNNHVKIYGLNGKLLPHGEHQWHDSLLDLDLSDNRISCNGAAALGYGLKCCHKLQSVKLQNNNIGYGVEVLLEELNHCPLLSLNLDGNNFSLFTEQLWLLPRSIQHLSLSNISFDERTKNEHQTLLQRISNYANLKVFNLENARIGLEEFQELGKSLKSVKEIQELRIGGNDWNCEKIKEGIISNYNLKKLHLQKTTLDSQCLIHLAENMRCSQIIDLNLSKTDLHEVQGACLLSEGLKHCSKMQNLDLSFNKLDSGDIKWLSTGVQNCKSLIKLNLSNNIFESDGASYLADSLICFQKLTLINLSSNKISSDGAIVLMKALKNCIEMEQLYIHSNCIGPAGAAAIADWISSTSTKWPRLKSCLLTVLSLDGNKLQTEGAIKIAEALQFCKKISFLMMTENDIGPEAANPLAIGLKNCAELHYLFLGRNNFDGDSIALLGDGLKYCHTLEALSLSHNRVTIDGAVAMAERLKHLHLNTLDLEDNGIHCDFELAEALPYCNIYTDRGLTNQSTRWEEELQREAMEQL